MAFEVQTRPDTGHDPEPGDDPPGWESHEFDTEAEAKAFMLGVNLANEATHGWTEGWLECKRVK